MEPHKIVSRQEWIEARKAHLAHEKEFTRARDRLSEERRALPWVKVDKAYSFDSPDGKKTLADLFKGKSQLVVQHFMFDPSWDEGCPSCTAGTDELSPGFFEHLHVRDTSYAMVSRAPLSKLERWKKARGWDLPWYSSNGSDFNYDFGVTIDESRGYGTYNYRSLDEYAALGQESMKTSDQPYDMPGLSCFLRVNDRVFHTYSQYARGLEATGGSYYFLDLTALGRQEEWEEPKGRSDSVRPADPDFAS